MYFMGTRKESFLRAKYFYVYLPIIQTLEN